MNTITRISIIILFAVLISTTIGGNGCLWVGQDDNNQSVSGSSQGLLGQPIIPAPPNGTSGIPINVTLSWNSVPNATDYDIYFGTENPPALAGSVPQAWASYRTSYNPGRLAYGTTYYWEVNPRNNIDASLGPIWVFSTVAASTPPQTFSPSPANNAANVPINSPLAWSCTSGADSFDIYFGKSNPPPFAANILRASDRTQYSPGLLDYAAAYYWQIDTKNNSGTTTGNLWTFQTASLPLPPAASSPAPVNNAANVLITTGLSWTSGNGVDYYDVYFSANNPPDFATSVPKGLYRTIYKPPALDYNTQYFWRVNAINTTGTTAGPLWTFTTLTQDLPAQASAPNPTDSATNVLTTTVLSWASAVNAQFYEVYFGTTTPPAYKTTTGKTANRTTYDVGALIVDTTYYWRIDARNSVGKTTGVIWNFKTLSPLPAQAANPNPANGTTGISISPQLSWTAAARATSYDVYFGTTTTGWTSIANTALTSYTPNTTLQYSTLYYWRIDAKNSFGLTQGNIWNFTTATLSLGTWTAKANLPSPRSGLSVGAVNNKIYAIGGATYPNVSTANEEYDPALNSWATKASMPTARLVFGLCVVNNKIYAIGGFTYTSILSKNEEYDPATNIWSTKRALPKERCWIGIGAAYNKIYVIGGFDGSAGTGQKNEEYDPATNNWTTKAMMPTDRMGLCIGVVNNKLYAIGGSGTTTSNEEYDPSTNSWTTKASMPTARWKLAIGIINNKIYAIGGSSGNKNEEYDPNTNTWAIKTPMPTLREDLGVGVVNNKIYAIGGRNNSYTYLGENEEYTP